MKKFPKIPLWVFNERNSPHLLRLRRGCWLCESFTPLSPSPPQAMCSGLPVCHITWVPNSFSLGVEYCYSLVSVYVRNCIGEEWSKVHRSRAWRCFGTEKLSDLPKIIQVTRIKGEIWTWVLWLKASGLSMIPHLAKERESTAAWGPISLQRRRHPLGLGVRQGSLNQWQRHSPWELIARYHVLCAHVWSPQVFHPLSMLFCLFESPLNSVLLLNAPTSIILLLPPIPRNILNSRGYAWH